MGDVVDAPFLSCGTLTVRNRALAFRHVRLQYWPVERRGRKCSPHWLPSMLVRKDPETAPLCPQCGDAMRLARKLPPVRPLSGLVVTYAEVADTSEPPNASPIPHHRSGFDRRAAYDIPCFVPALANANNQAWTTSQRRG